MKSVDIPGHSKRVLRSRMLLRQKWAYAAASAALPFLSRLGWKEYQVAAVRCFMQDFAEAYLGRKPCIFTSAFVPTELVYGLGAVPFLPEAAGGLAASFGLAEASLSACESLWYSPDLCSFHRSGLGAFALGLAPKPSAVIVSSHLCDGGKRTLFDISRRANCPFYILDVPYVYSDGAARWLAGQIESVARALVREVPGTSLRNMTRAIENSNDALAEYQSVCRLRRNVPAPWRGSEALNYVVLFLWSWGSPWLPAFYRCLRNHLQAVVGAKKFPVPEERCRLLWLNLRPYYETRVFRYLEDECQASVAFEEYSFPYWPRFDAQDPFMSLARKMMSNFGWGPATQRLAAIDRMVDEYRASGVIQFAQRGCRQSNGAAAILSDVLRRKGIPFLNLDGDGVDARNASEAQTLTRLGAFLELLERKKGG
ncbi:MAG: 2-hydroxyacyl-CoA dehydratase family protein [Bacillota bacterium]